MTSTKHSLFIIRSHRFIAEFVSSHGFTATLEAMWCQGPAKRFSDRLPCFQFQFCFATDLICVTFKLLYHLNDVFLSVIL